MVLFQFFAEATNGSVTAVVRRENLLRKMRFPRLAIPLSTVLTALMNLAATLVAVCVFAIASGVYPRWSWLELPLLIVVLAAIATGTGLLLSVLSARRLRAAAMPASLEPAVTALALDALGSPAAAAHGDNQAPPEMPRHPDTSKS